MSTYTIIWRYRVRPGALDAFLAAYNPGGAWATLFRQAEGYLETQLLRSCSDPLMFVTLDRWQTRADFESFKARFLRDYRTLDDQCGAFTVSEEPVGDFED